MENLQPHKFTVNFRAEYDIINDYIQTPAISVKSFRNYKVFHMKIKQLAQLIAAKASTLTPTRSSTLPSTDYRPTPYLAHPFLQSVYNITEPIFPFEFKRQKLFFQDGGHISLDWVAPQQPQPNPPILFIMHGLTGGSQMNYIKQLVRPAAEQGYCCVCLNSRGINNEMTSPIPFTGVAHTQLQAALNSIQNRYPNSPIYMVGTSFGGNYLLRYFLRCKPISSIAGLVLLAPPLNVGRVVDDMGSVYQKFFVKRYIEEVVTKHKIMDFWEQNGFVDMKKVKASQNLLDFHTNLTAKILGYPSAKEIFDQFSISDQQIRDLKVKTFFMLSKDDPIVSYNSMPLSSMQNNPNITLHSTEKGGHLCWFQGLKPKRWYPKPVLQYINTLRQSK